MKTNNDIIKTIQLNDLDKLLNTDLNFKISRGGRYLPIGDKWVTANAVASHIKTLAKRITPEGQKILNRVIDNFIQIDNNGYDLLKTKIKNAKPLDAVIMIGMRCFKTLFSNRKEERHEMLQLLQTRSSSKIKNLIQSRDAKIQMRHQLPLFQMKRFYAKVLETSDLDCKDLNGYTQSGALYSYLKDLKQYQKNKPLAIHLDRITKELEFAYQISLTGFCKEDEVKKLLVSEIQHKIMDLPASDAPDRPCVMIPGGSKTHAIMFKVEKNQNGTFSFTVINTGSGADHNFLKSAWTLLVNQRLTVQDIVYSNLTSDHLSKDFISKIITFREFKDMDSVNQWVENSLINGKVKWEYGRKHKGQRKGSCAHKNVSSILHEKMGDREYNRFKTFLTELEMKNFERLMAIPHNLALKEKMLAEGKTILKHRASKVK